MGSGLIEGFSNALSFGNLWYCFLGSLLGTLVGVIPGLGPTATMAILLPLTFHIPPTGAIIMLAGVYYGAMYGGSTTSILVNIPGEAASVVTCLDGYEMTKQGRAGEALAIAAIGSFIAGTAGVILLSFAGPMLADVALHLGPPEYFGLLFFSLTAILSFSGRGRVGMLKGIATGLVGMILASVGLDQVTGKYRLVFGISKLISGLNVISILMGLFGVAEVLVSAEAGIPSVYKGTLGHFIPRGQELKKGLFASLRGTASGLALGLIPGMIQTITTFIAYDIEKRISKYPDRFGKGCIEGVAAPEANNNAGAVASFVPLMALGIPTSATAAVLLAALTLYGLTPGPLLFTQYRDFTWAVIASMYIGNVILLVLNLPLVGIWARISLVPYRILAPLILGTCFVGTYSVRNNMFDVWTCIFFGLVGYVMKKWNWPVAPLILGFLLGDMVETHLRASLQMSGGSIAIFFTRPIAAVFIGLAAFMIIASRKFASEEK